MIKDLFARLADSVRTPGPVTVDKPGTEFHDRRATAVASNDRGGRPWSKVTGITLHQTACVLGERPARWDSLGAHVGVTRAGKVIHVHDFNRVVWHGNGFNSQCAGVEIDGQFPGLIGKPETAWHGEMMEPTAVQLGAARDVVRWIVAEVARYGGKVTALVAHRQSSASRRADPGEAIWRGVALPLMAELGLSDGGDGFKIGDGAGIPTEWSPDRHGRY